MPKKHLHIEELICHHCAEIIIENLESLDFIDEVNINYDTKDITIISQTELDDEKTKMVLDACLANGHCDEHSFNHLQDVITDEYKFEEIDCANCAAKVERALNKNEDIINAKVNFINKKIIITHMNNVEVYDVVSKIVNSTEPGAKIFKENEELPNKHNDIKCRCAHYEENNLKSIKIIEWIILVIGVCSFLIASLFKFLNTDNVEVLKIVLALVGYFAIGYKIIYKSFRSIVHGDIFNENTLMLIASAGALCIQEFFEGTMVILLYRIGEYFQDRATQNSKNAIKELMEMKVDTVTLKNGSTKNIKEVNIGEIISVRVGERIPLDGILKNGDTNLDMKTLTGESMPTHVNQGDEIYSGAINLSKVIEVEVTKLDHESTLTKVRKLVEEASNQKSKAEQFITKFARIYTPVVLSLALIIFLVQLLIIREDIISVLNNVFTILVISCPCALVISIPLAYFAGIGACSANGILVKGGNYLEALNNIKFYVFDKTGTITKGNFKVTEVKPVGDLTEDKMIEIIARAEQYSLHPIAKSIEDAYGKEITPNEQMAEEYPGSGVRVLIDNQVVLVGNDKLMREFNIKYEKTSAVGTTIYLAIDNKYYGYVVISDEIKDESKDLINYLNNKNIKTIMLTGDKEEVARDVAKKVGFNDFKAKLFPQDKFEYLRDLIERKIGKVAFVGDGINDTPSISMADVGFAMGGIGSDGAKECADIVIMNDDLSKITKAHDISRFTKKIIVENVIFILLVKVAALIVSSIPQISLGKYGMIIAIFADVGVCLLSILNVLRILRKYKNK